MPTDATPRCGASARSAARCSIGAISRRTLRLHEAAAIIFAWAPTIASPRSSTATSPRSAPRCMPAIRWLGRSKSYPVKLAGDREKSGISRGRRLRLRPDRRLRRRARRDGLPFSRRHDGYRRRRAHHAACSRKREAAASPMHHLHGVRRRAHGRGHVRADAAGEDDGGRHALHGRRQRAASPC